MALIDAHCHLANLHELLPVQPLLAEAAGQGITGYLSSALTQNEVEFHRANPLPGVLFSAGIHPNYDENDLGLEDIEDLCEQGQIWAVGEIGLDRGNSDLKAQLGLFIQQLELADKFKLPAVLHLVGHQPQAYEVLRRHPNRYLVHGYAGSIEAFRLLSRLESWFTISSRVLKPDKADLLGAMLDHGRFLFETDITRHYVKAGEANPLLRLLGVIDRTAEISGLDKEKLLESQEAAYQELTGSR